MIVCKDTDLFESSAEAFVCPVNTIGVMGSGIAKIFKQRYPDNFTKYAYACKNASLYIGTVLLTHTGILYGPKYIINFPTKREWWGNSTVQFIKWGLPALAKTVEDQEIRSVAIPALGCGKGSLSWTLVKPILVKELGKLSAIVELYAPIDF